MPFEQMGHGPLPLFSGRSHPEREKEGAVRASRPRWELIRACQFQTELVAQHLECRKLSDEVRAGQVEGVADVGQLNESISGSTKVLELMPESNEDDEF